MEENMTEKKEMSEAMAKMLREMAEEFMSGKAHREHKTIYLNRNKE